MKSVWSALSVWADYLAETTDEAAEPESSTESVDIETEDLPQPAQRSSLTRWLGALLIAVGIGGAVHGLWIPMKAQVAQVLLHRAWDKTVSGVAEAKPWPWADMYPTALLRSEDRELIVLAGATGATLAFGPGHISSSAVPGEKGNVAVAAHRDTHFEFLRDVEIGQRFELEAPDGHTRSYRVARTEVVDRKQVEVLDPNEDRLTLITCYPFDAPVAGGPLRFVVVALPESSEST